MANPRTLLAGAVTVVALVVGVVVAAGPGGGAGTGKPTRTKLARAKLTLERAVQPDTGYEEVLVSLPNQRLNNLGTTGGAKFVLLRCFDGEGRVTIRQRWPWPLVVEYGYPPHVHQPAVAKVLNSLRSCRLSGPGIDFRGRVAGRLPPVQPDQ